MSHEQLSVESNASDDKSKKYDRQLRLWGDHGQQLLETSHVCVINATATNTEILKNLILPGVGSFTIIDKEKVTGEDIGCNFFLDSDSLHKLRGEVTTDLILELNEDVRGHYVEEDVSHLLDTNPEYFTTFNIVIASGLSERALLRLGKVLWDQNIPLLVCNSYGMIGYLRLVLKQITVVESHPDNAHEDLRLDRPFPALVEFCDSLDLDAMSKKDHSHTPWLVLLYKYLQKWKDEHDGQGPRNYREKKQLKEMVHHGVRKSENDVEELEENFEEAMLHLNTSLVPTQLPSNVKEIFEHADCVNITQDSSSFWVVARAVKEFVNKEGAGALPLRGSIPDMTSDSERYIQLQNVYQEKANQDIECVINHLHLLLQTIGRDGLYQTEEITALRKRTLEDITESYIRMFCKNAYFLRVVSCTSLAEEHAVNNSKIQQFSHQFEDSDSDAVHYLMLRAVNRFHSEYKRYPGCYNDGSHETDIPKLQVCVNKLLQEWDLNSTSILDDYIIEHCRCGGAEIHSVAAYMGGCAAQEVIKTLTRQFVPINNTFIYNAVKQTSSVFTL